MISAYDQERPVQSLNWSGRPFIAKLVGGCLNCQDIGSDKSCEVGKTIWCPRLLETLKE